MVAGALMFAALLPAAATAQSEAPVGPPPGEVEEEKPFVPQVKPTLNVRRAAGAIVIDGRLDDAGWAGAAVASGFAEVQPDDQVRPDVETEALVTYDDAHLYLGFRAHDDNPGAIRAALRDRDDMFQDDWIGIILDTYGDGAQSYEIFVNPIGVQGDLLMASSGNEDGSFDLVFRSEGRVTGDGYVVEVAVPFSSLRFPDRAEQRWRATFIRTRPRGTRYQYSWATISRDDPCFPCQFGALTGIEGIRPGTNLDVLPALVGAQAATENEEEAPIDLDSGRLRLQPSVNLRYNFTPSLAAEATVNPDFSQVESDEAQIDVNSTFALFFPERRPFFQEGSDLFDTWIETVYTRSINDPAAATKLTGRFGRTSVAYLGAVDENSPILLPFEQRSAVAEGGRSVSNILRARRSFGENSFAGATLTDRRLVDGGRGTLASADLKWQFMTNYRLETQVAASDTREASGLAVSDENDSLRFGDGYTAALDGERFQGVGVFTSFDRNARHWNFDLAYTGYSPAFRTANGFVTQSDVHRVRFFQGYTFYPDGFFERIEPGMFAKTEYAYDGRPAESFAELNLYARLPGQTNVFGFYGIGRERFQDVTYEGLRDWLVEVNSRFSEPLTASAFVYGGRSIARNEDVPEVGRQLDLGLSATIQPLQRLVVEPSVRYASLRDRETGDFFFTGYVARARASFQFTRAWSLRLVAQYNDFDERFALEPLLAYKLNPFSVFYLGSTHQYSGAYDNPVGVTRLTQTERQIFFKFQYLVRR